MATKKITKYHGYCIEQEGDHYIAYVDDGGMPFHVLQLDGTFASVKEAKSAVDAANDVCAKALSR